MIDQNYLNTILAWISVFCIFLFTNHAFSQCPTIGAPNQTFCDIDNPRVIDLLATNTGDGIVWYTVPTGGVPLTDNIKLIDGTSYYADNDTGNCVLRPLINVTISGKRPTNVDVAVSRCSSNINTISQLSADGTNIEWYSEQNAGILLVATTPLVSGETYWVQQTVGICTSIRLRTTVTIIDPGEPTGDLEQFFCFDPLNPVSFVIADLSAIGVDINWYSSLIATSPLDPSTPLMNNTTYYATQTTFPCESTRRFASTVRIETLPDSGTDNSLNLCDSSTANISLLSQLGGAPDNGGTWAGPVALSNGDQGTLDISLLNFGTYNFIYTLAAQNSCPEVTSTVSVTIIKELYAGENGLLGICTNEPTVDLFGLLGGTADTGGIWSPALASGTGLFNPAVDPSDIYTYTVTPTAPCIFIDTATITVTVEQAPKAGPDAIENLCINDPAINLFTLLTGADTGGTWSPILASGSGVFDPAVDPAGAYTYTLSPSANCLGDKAIVSVNVSTRPFAGTNNTIELCTNDTTVDLFTILGGTPNTGGTWTPTLTSGTGVYDPVIDPAITYTYSLAAIGTCPANNATVTVNLNIIPNAGNDATITVCGSDAVFDLSPLLGVGANAGGSWSGPSTLTNADAGSLNPATSVSGNYIYTSLGTGACEDVRASVLVTIINPRPTLPADGEIFCIADNPSISDLIARVIPENGGTIKVYATASGTALLVETVSLISDNTYYVTETDISTACESTNRLEVSIRINDPQTPQLSNTTAEFCLVDTPKISSLNAFITSGNNVVWADAAVDGQRFSDTDILIAGDYYAIEEDVNGCRSVSSTVLNIIINNNPAPVLSPMGNELCGVERPTIAELETELSTEPELTFIWYDTAQGEATLNTTDLLIDNSTLYVATYNAITRCISNTRLEIALDLTACDLNEYPLLLPDGFSPNGDGINDTYDLQNVEFLYKNYTIEIYNRYGNLVFKGNNSTAPWDGTSNQANSAGNTLVPNGVYFYIFNFNRNNVSPKQGRIYLNR